MTEPQGGDGNPRKDAPRNLISKRTYDMTKRILFGEKLSNGWELYGKTGTGYEQNAGGSLSDRNIAWFIGWTTKDNRTIVFVRNRVDKNLQTRVSDKPIWLVIARLNRAIP